MGSPLIERWWALTVSNRRPTPCKGAALPTELSALSNVLQFKASFRPLPGRNFGTLAFLILIAAPVRGLRPVRAARLPTANVPKPTRETVPPFFRVVRTAPIVASNARPAAALDRSACLAMCSISSVLFTKNLLVLVSGKADVWTEIGSNSVDMLEQHFQAKDAISDLNQTKSVCQSQQKFLETT